MGFTIQSEYFHSFRLDFQPGIEVREIEPLKPSEM